MRRIIFTVLLLLPLGAARAETDGFERDRQAILAMAGEFDVSFRFEELEPQQPGYEPEEPYLSDARELVVVIEDRGEFISLQHILVLGDSADPTIIKHWRQDWTYQDGDLLEFKGHSRWERRRLGPDEARGTWTQAVYQTNDSPRYEAAGRWRHDGQVSTWESAPTWRPLPRREYTKRDDYHVLVATNRHVVSPDGWSHEQDNEKLVLDDAGRPVRTIVHETGLNTYRRDASLDLSGGREYWSHTGEFWQAVRSEWARLTERRAVVEIRGDLRRLSKALGAMAEAAPEVDAQVRSRIGEAIAAVLE